MAGPRNHEYRIQAFNSLLASLRSNKREPIVRTFRTNFDFAVHPKPVFAKFWQFEAGKRFLYFEFEAKDTMYDDNDGLYDSTDEEDEDELLLNRKFPARKL